MTPPSPHHGVKQWDTYSTPHHQKHPAQEASRRFGMVYNNTRWYAGWSAILRTNNYHTSRFTANNIFGSFNAYIGYNFGLKKRYRKKKQ